MSVALGKDVKRVLREEMVRLRLDYGRIERAYNIRIKQLEDTLAVVEDVMDENDQTQMPTLPTTNLPITVPIPHPTVPGVRVFSQDYVNKVVADTLAAGKASGELTGSEHYVFIAYSDLDRARIAAMVRVGDHLSAAGVFEHDWTGAKDTRFGGQIVYKG